MKKYSGVIIYSVSFLLCILLLITCKKEYSYEGGHNAEYTFVGSPEQCTQALIDGNYNTGVATDSSNSVQVMVKVTKAGNYDIATTVVDGITFSASGSFSDTTSSTYLFLYCSGTPDSAGVYTVLIPGTTGCYFTLTVIDAPPAQYTLAGSPNDCENPTFNGKYIQDLAMSTDNTVTINVDVITMGKYTITTDTVNGVSFAARGTFKNTGSQQIVLTASGTPAASELSFYYMMVGASSCGFNISYIPTGPLATYVLQSAVEEDTLICAPGSVQGTYVAGLSLTNVNTITVNAYVTVPGNFTISTTLINGMKFQFSGTFTSMGAQDVILKGSGTPVNLGTFAFTPQIVGPSPLGGNSCGSDVVVN